MKSLLALCIAVLTATAAFAADAVPVFNATLTVGKESRFLLLGIDGKASPWMKIGDSFEGYAVKAYDAKASVLDLEKDGKITRVTLASDAAVAAGNAAPIPATLEDAQAVMNKIHIEELLNRSLAGQRQMFAKQIDRIGANFPNADPEDLAAFKDKVKGLFDSALDVNKMKDDLTRIYSETFTKDELDQISAFYDTPLGQTLLAKQPAIQEKLQATLLPRMAELGPQIQKMAQQFAAGQAAKKQAAAPAQATPPSPASK